MNQRHVLYIRIDYIGPFHYEILFMIESFLSTNLTSITIWLSNDILPTHDSFFSFLLFSTLNLSQIKNEYGRPILSSLNDIFLRIMAKIYLFIFSFDGKRKKNKSIRFFFWKEAEILWTAIISRQRLRKFNFIFDFLLHISIFLHSFNFLFLSERKM